jgi:hypothetical protein
MMSGDICPVCLETVVPAALRLSRQHLGSGREFEDEVSCRMFEWRFETLR